jgi:mono/diheme cytochrome c family protein
LQQSPPHGQLTAIRRLPERDAPMMRLLRWLLLLGIVGAGAGWFLTAPDDVDAAAFSGLTGDADRGALVFAAAGCASCHTAPDAAGADAPVLSGGQRFVTAFGTFIAPNISPDPAGIGDWTDAEVIRAVMRGVGRDGAHLFPALPYDAYGHAAPQDMVDLVTYMRTLPADPTESQPHEVAFPFNIRRAVGGWKLLFRSDDFAVQGDLTPAQERGRYLAEALAHCGECHTPRNALGGLDRGQWLAGGPNPDGEGTIPNITPGALQWTEGQIAEYLKSGFTPDFDTAGGQMAHVVRNMAQLTDDDRLAIAAYLKLVPPVAPAATE